MDGGALAAELAAESAAVPSTDAAREAYSAVLRPYHSWLLRRTFDMIAPQIPSFDEVVQILGDGLGDADRELQIVHDMRAFVREGKPLLLALQRIFGRLQLEDLRRV